MITGLLLIFIPFLLLEAFFSASEIALISANRRRLRERAEQGHRGAALALKLVQAPERLVATTLLGSNLAEISSSILVTAFLIEVMGQTGEIVAVLLLPPLILILAEITPKSIGRQLADSLAQRLGPILWVVSWIIYPVTFIFAGLSRAVLFLLGSRHPSQMPFITREDLHLVVKKSGPEVDLETPERQIIQRILHFSLHSVKEAMVPLIRVAAIPDTLTVAQTLEEFRTSRFSRLPVYHRRIDNLIGVVHAFDLLGEEALHRSIRAFMRPITYVPELKKIDRLLAEMQRQAIHLAAVVDEYGGAVGIVTIEDLLEEIVGEIADEFDQEVTPYKKLGEGHYLVNARMEVEILNEALHLNLPPGDYETLAGFLIAQSGDLPRVGEHIRYNNLRFTVRQADARTLKEVEIFVDYEPV
ncbi:MAG: hemolysin family protein [Syntrophales bacterium]|nr:hemolysin family protein [Syntrophales bacterium]